MNTLVSDSGALQSRPDRIEVRHLNLPTGIRPFVLPDGRSTPTAIPIVVIRVTDTDGAEGFSLLWSQQLTHAPLLEACLRYLAALVTSHPLANLPEIDAALTRATAFFGTDGVTAFAVSGLKMAIEDLVCRRRRQSLADVLGRKRDQVQAYQTGLMLHATVDELVGEATDIATSGIRAIKMIVGKPTLSEDADRIEAVRECLPSDVMLMVDALQRWDTDTALDAAQRFADFGLIWIEDPIPHGDVAGYEYLTARSPVAVATGEALYSPCSFRRILDAGVPFVIGELERVGGMCAWVDLAHTVNDANAVMLPHLYPHVSAQLLATLPQSEVWLEFVPWFDNLVSEPLVLGPGGRIEISSQPGSGFTPSPDAIDGMALGPWKILN